MAGWTVEAFEFGLGVLCYLYGARKAGLLYQRVRKRNVTLYFDASWGSEPRPMTGYVIFFNGSPIAWAARKLKIVPFSSCESETAAGVSALKTLTFLRNVLTFLKSNLELPVVMHTDNEACRLAAHNPGATQRTRFFEIWMAALRKHQLDRTIDIQWCSTNDMIADIMTKPLDKTTFLKHKAWLVYDPKMA